eukprot:evm.model.scf_713.2 EVM.evm.TU.scf_713.2   scf_713:32155-34696(+)
MDDSSKGVFQRLRGDIETGEVDDDVAVRNGFIRKVFGILAAQLLLTSAIAAPFFLSDTLRTYIHTHLWPLYLALGVSFAVLVPLICIRDLARRYPINYILLFAFTAAEGYLVGTISSTYNVQAVVLAFFLTAGVTVGLSLFAMQTKYDITMLGGVLYSALWILLLCSLIMIFIPGVRVLQTVYAGLGALLFSAYLVYDVQLIAGGRQLEIGLDDYVPAALNIYLDVINIFLYILQLVGDSRNQ